MKIDFLWLGKTKYKEFAQIIGDFDKRLNHYCSHSLIELKEPKTKFRNREERIKNQAEVILSKISSSDYMVLLDERGSHLNSIQFSKWLQHKMNISIFKIVFVIAGAEGAHEILKKRADYTLSLSHMTLTHDMVRIFIIEQVYRAFTIIRGEKYHNE